MPSITVEGNGTLRQQWTVSEDRSVKFTTSDEDGESVTMDTSTLPAGSTLWRAADSRDTWEFKWKPANTDPVELV